MLDPYSWFARYYVLPLIQPQLNAIQAQISELQTTMSAADDKVAKLAADVATADAKVDALVAAFNALKSQLQNDVGLSPDSLAALDAADAAVNGIAAKSDAAVNPPAS